MQSWYSSEVHISGKFLKFTIIFELNSWNMKLRLFFWNLEIRVTVTVENDRTEWEKRNIF